MGEGLAFVKLWALNPKTGARSSSLRTGFPAPTIDDLASRASASGGGLDIEILLGEDGLAAVAKAEAAADAQAAADAEFGDSGSGSGSAGGEPGAAHTEDVHAEADKKDARVAATGAAATAADKAKPAGGRAQDRDSAGTMPSGDGKTSRPRWLALEVEVHACGDIDVPYLMAVIKVCFEQVGTLVGIEAAETCTLAKKITHIWSLR